MGGVVDGEEETVEGIHESSDPHVVCECLLTRERRAEGYYIRNQSHSAPVQRRRGITGRIQTEGFEPERLVLVQHQLLSSLILRRNFDSPSIFRGVARRHCVFKHNEGAVKLYCDAGFEENEAEEGNMRKLTLLLPGPEETAAEVARKNGA